MGQAYPLAEKFTFKFVFVARKKPLCQAEVADGQGMAEPGRIYVTMEGWNSPRIVRRAW